MGSKKKVRNSFYFFMVEFKEREEARGRTFPNGMKDVAAAADSEWQNFTPEQKKPYEAKAKKWKSDQRQTADKFTTLGTRFQAVDEKLRREEEEKLTMNQKIESLIASLQNKTALVNQKFFLIHVNFYCQLESNGSASDVFIPAEIAIVEFNLRDGIRREFHTFVKASIPSGYAYAAKVHSEETHEIPIDFAQGESNSLKILHQIKSFLLEGQTSRVLPVMYTMPNNRNLNNSHDAVKSTLKCLCEASVCVADEPIFQVYLLGKLMTELKNACQAYSTSQSKPHVQNILEMELEVDHFNYCRGLGCEFHETIDRTLYCSLSVVKRWVYIICDHCCQYLDIQLDRGKHCPVYAAMPETKAMLTQSENDEKVASCDYQNDNEITGSYLASTRSQNIERPQRAPNQRCWSTVTKGESGDSNQHQPTKTFSEEDFPAIGQLSMAEPRNQNQILSDRNFTPVGGVLSESNFPTIGRGRSQLRGLGRGRGMVLNN